MLHRLLTACVALLVCGLASVGSAADAYGRSGVEVRVTVETDGGGPVVVATFTPRPGANPLHLYGKDLKAGLPGVATRIELADGAPTHPRGPVSDDQPTHDLEGLAVYPEGSPVTLRLPIESPVGDGSPVTIPLLASYMACTSTTCLPPVKRAPYSVQVPSKPAASAPPTAAPAAVAVPPAPVVDEARIAALVRAEVAQLLAEERVRARDEAASAIRWRRPQTAAEAEGLIREAQAANRPVLLDFTGPSCVNCQRMAKTVFRLPEVVAAWNAAVPIEIDTDTYTELADWQQRRFHDQSRPLYIRIEPLGLETAWNRVFATDDRPALDRFLAFLRGGTGDAAGTGGGWWGFIGLALAGGLFTLLMPCTYPMIPFTLTFFAKQAAGGARLLPLALFYGAGIIACFVGVGLLITAVFGASLATVAGHPVTNLAIAGLFVVMGLALLGVWFLRLPAGVEAALGGGRGGYLGALVMGLTFAVTAFTCTAPFAGSVLAAAVATGAWGGAILGMAIYASAIAVPFAALAAAPGLLKKLPKAGAWMNEGKVVGGLVELAAAFKFLAICDVAWGWGGLVGRTTTLTAWAAIAAVIALYLIGRIRLPGDEPVAETGLARLFLVTAFVAVAIACAAGLAGASLGVVESFFPGDPAP